MLENFLLAIPVFNEARYLDRVISEAGRYCRNILIVDDGSTDDTPLLLRRYQNIHIITHPENRGYGKSLADAFDFAKRRHYTWLITMDCDEQHEASQIPKFIQAAERNNVDIISGTRYPDGYNADTPAPADRKKINRHITTMLNKRLGFNITDAFCGFKAYRVTALHSIRITVPGYAMPVQFWVQAFRAGLRIRELSVRLIYKDPTRHFGGILDDPEARLKHYLEVFESEWASPAIKPRENAGCLPCR